MNFKVSSIVIAVLGAGLIILGLWWIPRWQLGEWSGRLEPKDFVALENGARATIAQIMGGVVLLLGLYFTAMNLRITQEAIKNNFRNAQETLLVSQEGQITDRFTKGIAQLGDERLSVRLGGIYALERIAKDSKKDDGPILEVLAAYVRENAPAKALKGHPYKYNPRDMVLLGPPADIQAVLSVLGRRKVADKEKLQRIDLANTNLRFLTLGHADLRGCVFFNSHLEEVNFTEVNLHGVGLARAHLKNALFMNVNLGSADLSGSHLNSANAENTSFAEADLSEADLSSAILIGADLSGANMTNAVLSDANLAGAKLHKTNLTGVNLVNVQGLTWAQIKKAEIDETTKLPAEFEARRT